MTAALPPGVTVLERGWLSSNNVLVHSPDGASAVLIDSSHVNHAGQTVALVRHALGGARLERLINTHLHSDHCGGNAALARAFAPLPIAIPPGGYEAVRRWDEAALTYRDTAQRCERFEAGAILEPGATTPIGGQPWQVLAAPGHDPDAVMLFDPHHGLLVSGDALWGNGFGVVFPELDGEPGFDDVAAVLDAIERLAPAVVVPGHGPAFTDVSAALARARSRLASWRADPARHAHHAAKVLLKYHLMEEGAQPLPALHAWARSAPLFERLRRRFGGAPDAAAACDRLLAELCAAGAATLRDGTACDA